MAEGQGVTLGELAEHIGARLLGDLQARVHGVAALEHAVPGMLSFLSNRKYRKYLKSTSATAVILAEGDAPACPVAALVSNDPYLAYARAARILYAGNERPAGVHPSAVVDPAAQVDAAAWIGPLAVIGARVRIAARVYIGPACVVENGCEIGEDSYLVAQVTLCRDTSIGCRVLIQPGAVLGSDGFGFAREGERWLRIPQIGRVRIGNDVEIGANTTVDRGALGDTVIADGAILDNLIQIGHNVSLGERSAVAACTGISGSTRIGRDCILAGDVGVAGHLEIGDGVFLAAGSRVSRDLSGPGSYGGVLPVDPEPLWQRNIARIRHLDELARRVRQLERRIEGMDGGAEPEGS
jgi:UDP-3-O-[3-hydroxymyristoyl] glucosamine N-acyltransferase